jgi:hypothetical protein
MRTDMFGLSMLADDIAPDYEATVDATIRSIFGDPASARSEPAKVAQAILRVAAEAQPPVRLLLGGDAVSAAAAAAARRAEEDARWKAVSLSTDRDGVADSTTASAPPAAPLP